MGKHKYPSSPEDYTEEDWRLCRRWNLEAESGLFRLHDFVRSMDEGKSVEQDTLDYFHTVFTKILDEIAKPEFTYILKTEDAETGEVLARNLNLLAGKSLVKQQLEYRAGCLFFEITLKENQIIERDQLQDVTALSQSELRHRARPTQARAIEELANEKGITTERELKSFERQCRRQIQRLEGPYRQKTQEK